ncbi:TonB-dependent receptor [Hymenobacter sp. BT178]|uniref:TonB-dependent receptor n=2 Tax=Hymenobacter lucidus TaxID=2880930 RepID=A0ABS8AY06_9BACT|nr:TonB-dependent receptor [Hymenobacter lucidus]MCB2410700.1 TonB-dependent receptor [Hymenobacter lucidus]
MAQVQTPTPESQAQARSARSTLAVSVLDSLTQAPVPGASVGIPGTSLGTQTNAMGVGMLAPGPRSGTVLVVSAMGYRMRRVRVSEGAGLRVYLAPTTEELEEVVVTATRTNSRIADLPSRVEVLGTEEMAEESGIKPGNIASLLGDLAGTQIQPTSPTTGNADVRIQGLPGRYAQILRDGLPLLGAYAGGFGILQIPPLDLRQIELVKGSSSTLYGGGAIAGLVNLVSKTPVYGVPEYSITANQSTLRETNLNGFAAARGQRLGYTLYLGGTRQREVDVDGDGFADLPRLGNVTVHPRLFCYPSPTTQLAVGYTGTAESRRGGHVGTLRDEVPDADRAYTVTNLVQRHTADVVYTLDSLAEGRLTLKGTVSGYSRRVRTRVNGFDARQITYFAEASYLHALGKQHTLVGGLNLTGEALRPDAGSPTPLLNRYTYATVGAFVQDDWRTARFLTVQTGLRLDHHNRYGNFLLPRLALLFTVSPAVSARLNGGWGYRVPSPYVNEQDERQYDRILPLAGVSAERSTGLSGDVNYARTFPGDDGENIILSINQSFYYTQIDQPLVLDPEPDGPLQPLRWRNESRPVVSQGLETYVRLREDENELYLGYSFTDSRRTYDPLNPRLALSARHKFAAVGLLELVTHWAVGVEASYTGRQYLSDGSPTPGYPIVAGLVRYRSGPWTVVLNGENLLDYRQTRREPVVHGDLRNPDFRELWAPVEGRVVNLSVNWRLVR